LPVDGGDWSASAPATLPHRKLPTVLIK